MNELGIEGSVQKQLPKVKEAFKDYLQQVRKAARDKMVAPTTEQAGVEKHFPAIAKWVNGCGHIEIGDQEGFGFVVRALDYGGLVFEDDKAASLAEAMVALEKGLAESFNRRRLLLPEAAMRNFQNQRVQRLDVVELLQRRPVRVQHHVTIFA